MSEKIVIYLFLFERTGNVLQSIHRDCFNNAELSYSYFTSICNKVWKEPFNYIFVDMSRDKNIYCKLRIN